jgi:hypothetical protein
MPSTSARPSLPLLHLLYKDRAHTPRPWHSRSWLACFAAAALCVTAMACGTTTRFAPLNPTAHQLRPKPAAAVEVYSTGLPARPYTEVGLIQGMQESEYSFHDMPEIIAEMRAEAGRIGCDALILNGPNSRSTAGIGNLPGEGKSVALQGFWGTCVAYLPTQAYVDDPPPPVALQPNLQLPPRDPSAPPATAQGPIVRPAPERTQPLVRPAPERTQPLVRPAPEPTAPIVRPAPERSAPAPDSAPSASPPPPSAPAAASQP